MCESSRYSRQQRQMTAFSLGARLHLDVSSNRALSLPQSFVAAKRRQKPAPSSEGAEAAPPQTAEIISASTGEPRFALRHLCGKPQFLILQYSLNLKNRVPFGTRFFHHFSAQSFARSTARSQRSYSFSHSSSGLCGVNTRSLFLAAAISEKSFHTPA